MCDDLGWADLKAFNSAARPLTPHVSEMAAAGMKFTRFYAAAPVCSPTRGSCLTGRHPSRYGIPTANAGHIPADEVLLPELVRAAGYVTGHFGKWHLGTLTFVQNDSNRGRTGDRSHFSPPWENGYDRVFATEAKVPTFDPMWNPTKHDGKAWAPVSDRSAAANYGTRYWNELGAEVTDNLDGDDSKVIMDRAEPFIRSAVEAGKPFFTTIWFHAPHLPVVASSRHTSHYADASLYDRSYFGCITALDEQIGRLRETLRELKIADNTLVWFCSDNGPEGQEASAPGRATPFRGRKRSLYEGGVRVPGIVEWPAVVQPGQSTGIAAVTSDFLPTLLDALDLKMPDQRPVDGISLMPALKGDVSRERSQPLGFQSGNQAAMHNGDWKIYSNDRGTSWELYNLREDPGETHDLSGNWPEEKKNLIASYQNWKVSCQRSSAGTDYPM
ncbi:MAG: sulfatase-like hydrolase/transferase [Verrucomicrobiae bacterium]|nr:sulfatase-like hydrolase/transferase [Verrucomicrobiae bacterium]